MAAKKSAPPKNGDLRVWHIPQIPGKPFHVAVPSVATARIVLTALARYDAFQLEHNIKPDYCNVQGLEVYEDNEWCEWEDANGENIRSAP